MGRMNSHDEQVSYKLPVQSPREKHVRVHAGLNLMASDATYLRAVLFHDSFRPVTDDKTSFGTAFDR